MFCGSIYIPGDSIHISNHILILYHWPSTSQLIVNNNNNNIYGINNTHVLQKSRYTTSFAAPFHGGDKSVNR